MKRILLVDDAAIDRRLFAEILEKESEFKVDSCNDGQAALDSMEMEVPDIVLTDMQMPVMDGLELVKHVRERFPRVPVILITGYGSEDLATKALRAGAAGYVPKSHSGQLLIETVRHVLELTEKKEADHSINSQISLIHYELELENDETLIPGVLQLARQRLTDGTNCDDVTMLQIEVALEHAVLNAIYHGNLELEKPEGARLEQSERIHQAKDLAQKAPYSNRRVSIVMHIAPDAARLVIKDEGKGFDVKEVSSIGLTHSLRGEFGRGLFLMWAFMDKVVFDKSGNSVTLIKKFPPTEALDQAKESKKQQAVAETEPIVLASLRPKDGGKAVDVKKKRITIGRDASCDVVIKSAAVSHHHCLLFLHEGWWFIRDLKSKNGIKVNGVQYDQHLVPPSCVLSVGPHDFTVDYQPYKLGAVGITPPVDPF